jgi:hypothetical protein
VLSYGVWQQELGGDPAIVGKRIVLDGTPTTVIGVMPRGFFFPSPEYRLWKPLDLDPASGMYQGTGWLVLVARTKPGLDDAAVQSEVNRLALALGEQFTYPAAWDKTKDPFAKPLREELVGNMRPALLLLGLVSQSFADKAWPGQDPIGRQLRERTPSCSTWRWSRPARPATDRCCWAWWGCTRW